MRDSGRYARTILAALTLAGCFSTEWPGGPTAPAPPAAPSPSSGVTLWGMVVEESGLCIPGAAVRLVDGTAVGDSIVQQVPCDPWDYANGFTINGLAPGVPVTIRASAPGYVSRDVTVVTPGRGDGQTATVIELASS